MKQWSKMSYSEIKKHLKEAIEEISKRSDKYTTYKSLKVGGYFYIDGVEYQIQEKDVSRVYYHKDLITGEKSFFDIEYLCQLIDCGVAIYYGKRNPLYEQREKIMEMLYD